MVTIGLVGKPSAGKSTFFKAATLMDVDIANYPFTTINPNTGYAHVRIPCVDKEFDTQCNPRTGWCVAHERYVPFSIIDVAGLVPGAHEGRGRGLDFLSDLNEADALIHIIDVSGSISAEGEDVAPGSYDPAEDIRFLETELDYWYLAILKRAHKKFARKVQQEKLDLRTVLAEALSGVRVKETHVKDILPTVPQSPMDWSEQDLERLATYFRKQSKPLIVVANKIDKKPGAENYQRLTTQFPEHLIIPCSAEIELALREAAKHSMIAYQPGDSTFAIVRPEKLNEKQQAALAFMQSFLETHGTTGVQDALNRVVFDILHYIAVFPGGVKKLEDSEGRRLPDCFLMPPGTTALDFARSLHTDFAKHFIRAVNVKTKLPVGKEHFLQHRDVIEIISGK